MTTSNNSQSIRYQLKTQDPATAIRAETGQKYQRGHVCINSQLETNLLSGIPNNVGRGIGTTSGI